ncbi:AAA family ATPase [Pararoseomonas sp. SCSIO 73927]|uniref:AAA family ATPase n=1 Tax=Pararoseomonas sp. SCSIO 73927 TaxID=3114537 RepID=UPI0030D37942
MPSDLPSNEFPNEEARQAWAADIRKRGIEARQADGITWGKMADQVGGNAENKVGESTLAAALQGSYKGDADKVLRKVEIWLQSREARQAARARAPSGIDFQLTPTAQDITLMLEHAQFTPDMVLVSGAPGIGKTMTSRRYAKATSGVYMMTGQRGCAGAKSAIQDLAQAMGLSAYGARTRTSRDIIVRLQDSGGLLIWDEAQYYGLEGLDQIRHWHDQCGVGIAILGNDLIPKSLGRAVSDDQYAQLARRVGASLSRTEPKPGDIETILGAWGFTDPEVLGALRALAGKPGALGTLNKVIAMALRAAAAAGEELKLRHVERAWLQIDPTRRGGRP